MPPAVVTVTSTVPAPPAARGRDGGGAVDGEGGAGVPPEVDGGGAGEVGPGDRDRWSRPCSADVGLTPVTVGAVGGRPRTCSGRRVPVALVPPAW